MNSKEIKPIALAVIELRLSKVISQSVSQSISVICYMYIAYDEKSVDHTTHVSSTKHVVQLIILICF